MVSLHEVYACLVLGAKCDKKDRYPCDKSFVRVSTWMGDRPGTTCSRQGWTFTSASSQMKFIRKKAIFLVVHYRFRFMRYLALHLFPSELIRLLHRLFCVVRDRILNNLWLEVEAKLFYEQRIPHNPWWKNYFSVSKQNSY